MEPKLHRAEMVGNVVQVQLQPDGNVTSSMIEKNRILGANNSTAGKQKIPRPANAFMLFANEWRKKLAVENPRESNKDISVRPVKFIYLIPHQNQFFFHDKQKLR